MKKNKITEPNKLTLYLEYDENRSGGGCYSNEPYSTREDEYINFQLKFASRTEPHHYDWHEVEIEATEYPKIVYVVLATYDDGDSFGHTYGHWDIEGCFTSLEAADKVKADIDKAITKEGKSRHGYFSHKETIEIVPLIVR